MRMSDNNKCLEFTYRYQDDIDCMDFSNGELRAEAHEAARYWWERFTGQLAEICGDNLDSYGGEYDLHCIALEGMDPLKLILIEKLHEGMEVEIENALEQLQDQEEEE